MLREVGGGDESQGDILVNAFTCYDYSGFNLKQGQDFVPTSITLVVDPTL